MTKREDKFKKDDVVVCIDSVGQVGYLTLNKEYKVVRQSNNSEYTMVIDDNNHQREMYSCRFILKEEIVSIPQLYN